MKYHLFDILGFQQQERNGTTQFVDLFFPLQLAPGNANVFTSIAQLHQYSHMSGKCLISLVNAVRESVRMCVRVRMKKGSNS